ncbi:hypothetical protein EDC96DRAFT_194816 [Choanephora cucurbitarum]|nr:hypothetical protein EDC96DRAFT_194816 [Choanephora cucurbitarum]
MNDISYQPKVNGNLFAPEVFSFNRKSDSFSMPQDYDQLKNNMYTADLMSSSSIDASNLATNPVSCDLQEVITYYQSQPELLRLILLSKVEEDKRRSEEAKLRAKELDMLLLQQQQQLASLGSSPTPDISSSSSSSSFMSLPSSSNFMPVNQHDNNNFLAANQFINPTHRRPSALDILMDDANCPDHRRDSALGSSFDGSSNSEELEDSSPFSPQSNASMLSMSFPPQPMMSMVNSRNSLQPLSPAYSLLQTTPSSSSDNSLFSPQLTQSPEQLPQPEQTQDRRFDNPYFPQRPRRRREMQAISKIVETREYPYIDGFFWKNNGNTIQKKTGNKSVYYKCSNSTKGCPVNKTVTWKDNGEYLIKYRGEHLGDCGKVQRIVDM